MSQRYQYVSIDTIIAKYLRDFKGLDFNEDEIIEWAGEACGYMKLASSSEEAIAFVEVSNYQIPIPTGLHYIIQIAKHNAWTPSNKISCTPDLLVKSPSDADSSPTESCCGPLVDCHGEIIGDKEIAYYRPYFDLQYEYLGWCQSKIYQQGFTPVRLSNNVFFNTLVCRENEEAKPYKEQEPEYTIVGDEIRFSFKEGFVALAYLRQRVDPTTGYPLIPDDEYAKSAITYYITWKVKQREAFNHREGAAALAKEAENQWNSYIKKFKNKTKMPFGVDDYEDLMQQQNYILPRNKRYYGFFGHLGKMEDRIFNDPVHTNKYRFGYRRRM